MIYTVDSDVAIMAMYYSRRLAVNLELGATLMWAIQIDNQSYSRAYHQCMPFQVVIRSVHSTESVKQSGFPPGKTRKVHECHEIAWKEFRGNRKLVRYN